MKEFEPSLHIVLETFDSQESVTYGEIGYWKYTYFRAHIVNRILQANITVWIVESDTIWFADPALGIPSNATDIVSLSDMAGSPTVVAIGFLLIHPTDAVKKMWEIFVNILDAKMGKYKTMQLTHDIGNSGSEQTILTSVIKDTC